MLEDASRVTDVVVLIMQAMQFITLETDLSKRCVSIFDSYTLLGHYLGEETKKQITGETLILGYSQINFYFLRFIYMVFC